MASEYITKQGDTFDSIAKEAYDDESYASLLMQNNVKLIDNFVFDDGVKVTIPDKPDETEDVPEWRS